MKKNKKILVLAGSICGFMLFVSNICNAESYPATTATPLTADLSMNQHKLYDLSDIITKGPWVDVRAYASINAAVTAIGSTQTTLLVPDAQTLTANLTIPSTLSLKILKGGSVIKSSTYTLTINGYFEAGLYQVFSGFSAGDITFGSGTVKEVIPQWWGARGDGVTDDSAAINAAGWSLTNGGIVFFPMGIYMSNNISHASVGIRFIGTTPEMSAAGDTSQGTVLRLNAFNTLLNLNAASSLENIYLDGNEKGQTLIRLLNSNSTTFSNVTFLEGVPAIHATSTCHVRLNNVLFRNCGNGSTTPAIYIFNGNTLNSSDWWFTTCTWEEQTGDQIEIDSSGSGQICADFHFFAPKAEMSVTTYKFLKGEASLINIFGGYLRNSAAADVIYLTSGNGGSSGNRIIGTYLEGLTRAVYIEGNNNVIGFCNLYCPSATAGNISISGNRNKVIGCPVTGGGYAVDFTGSSNINLANSDPNRFSANKNSIDQTIGNASWTKVTFTNPEYNDIGTYNSANSKWIPASIGKGHISASIEWKTMVDLSLLYIVIYKNGSAYKGTSFRGCGTGPQSISVDCDVKVDAVTDYFEVYCYQNTGGNRNINGDPALSYFIGHMLN